jgi:hypothetical protein
MSKGIEMEDVFFSSGDIVWERDDDFFCSIK